MHRLVVATTNPGKLSELRSLFPREIELLSLQDVNVTAPVETGQTFLDNAMLKADHASKCGLFVFADDSGLEVEGLDYEPGVRSARFAGAHADDHENNRKLVHLLRSRPDASRRAWFRCAIVMQAPDDEPVWAIGQVEGRIVSEPRGTNGFGYDPHFELNDAGAPELTGRTMAELALEQKNAISHRARAYRALVDQLRKRPRRIPLFDLLIDSVQTGGATP